MNMNLKNKIYKLFGVCLALGGSLLLPACINDELPACDSNGGLLQGVTGENLPDCYLEVKLNIPSEVSSRSTTKDNGTSSDLTDSGIALESTVESIQLFFFDNSEGLQESEKYLLCSFSSTAASNPTKVEKTSDYLLTQKVEIDQLKKILGKKVRIYALANLTSNVDVNEDTTESDFLKKTIDDEYIAPFASIPVNDGNPTTYGRLCPMANYDYFDGDFTDCDELDGDATPGQVILEAEKIFNRPYEGSDAKPGDKKYAFTSPLSLERMVARVDFKGNTLKIGETDYPYLYKLPNAESSIEACNSTDGGVYLKLSDLTLKNVLGSAYLFRHTAIGTKTNVENVANDVEPFKVENDNTNDAENFYRWIASSEWGKSAETKAWYSLDPTSTPESIGKWLTSGDSYVANTGGYSPWYYINENTVANIKFMNLNNSTYIEFKFELWDATTHEPYVKPTTDETQSVANEGEEPEGGETETEEPEEEIRITLTSGDKSGFYKVLEKDKVTGHYYLKYKYLIPHHLPINPSGSVDGDSGKFDGDLAPMQYAIVRNNIYQIGLTGITSLPHPNEPDNLFLAIDLKVLSWVRRDIDVVF